jgi:hypothetical protein
MLVLVRKLELDALFEYVFHVGLLWVPEMSVGLLVLAKELGLP